LSTLESRLRAAVQAVASANEKTTAADAAMARLRAAIEAVPQHQGAINSLANADSAAFEQWAKTGEGEAPAIDAAAHDAARQALVAAQAKASAATAALQRIEQERMKARAHGEAAQKAIAPLAYQIVLPKRVSELLDELAEIQTAVWHKLAQVEEAHAYLIAAAETLPKGSAESHEVYVTAEKLAGEIRQRKHSSRPADANAIRASWLQEIDAAIDAHANNEMEK
jgi:hypothetical protein